MKKIVFISLLLITIKGMCQYDTSHVRIVFDYLQTNEFKSSLKQLSDRQTEAAIGEYKAIRKRAQAYRKEQQEDVLFWVSPNNCFIPSHDFFIPDTASRYLTNSGDSLRFRRFIKQTLNMYYPLTNFLCTEKMAAEIYFLNGHILELHHFIGTDPGMKFGYTEVLRFKIDAENKAELLLIGGIFHN